MKAKITQPVRKREVLQEAIPLDAPFYICLDVSSVCNIVCKYCVQFDLSQTKRRDFCRQIMPLELAKKVIDDLRDFSCSVKVFTLHGWGEPLLNPHIADIISYARQSGKINSVETITNGILLTPSMSDKLIRAGLQRINISVQAMSAEGYEKICGKRVDVAEFAQNVRYMYEHKDSDLTMYVKIGDMALQNKAEEQLFYDTFGDICDEIYVEKIINVRDDSLANDNIGREHTSGVFGQDVQGLKVCPYLFFRLFVCPDGVCALCNADWYRSEPVGNVTQSSLREIWEGKPLRELQRKHLRGERGSIELCSRCGNIKYYTNPADNLDKVADKLLQKLEER